MQNIIINKIKEILKRKPEQKYKWNDSLYEDIKLYLSIDERWQLWEEIIHDSLNNRNEFEVIYDSSVTDAEKWYDIIINNKKVEIKTATITSWTWLFQHEHLEAQRDYDYIFFLDIAPNNIFLTITKKTDIIWSKKKWDWKNKTAIHRRPNWDYKCDFSINHIYNKKIPKFRNFRTWEIKSKNDLIKIIEYINE